MKLKIVIYGVGMRLNKDIDFIKSINDNARIIAFADKAYDSCSLPEPFEKIPVVSPQQLCEMKFDGIYITSNKYRDEISLELINQGVSYEKIWSRDYIKLQLFRHEKRIHGSKFINRNANKKIMILTTDMGLSGGILVSVYAAMALKEKGIDVLLVTPSITKEMLKLVKKLGLPVLEKKALPIIYPEDREWYEPYDYVIVTVFQMINCAMHIGKEKPLLWWIHEPKSKWTNYYEDTIEKFPDCNSPKWMKQISIAAVSDVAKKSFNSFYPNVIKKCLPFGIPDENADQKIIPITPNRISFAIIAGYGEIKGQDLMFQAIRKLSPAIRNCISLKLIGISDYYKKEILDKVSECCAVQIFGILTHEEVCNTFDSIDVVVCPSYIETMSMTTIEGMMYGKVCITSDNTGVAGYIDGTNGFVFKAGNSSSLAGIIEKIVSDNIDLNDMQIKARNTYEKYFSMNAFYDNLMAVVENRV